MNVLARRVREEDIEAIKEIGREYSDNPLPEKFETAAAVEFDDAIKAFGVTRTILEAVLYCSGTNREKVIALRELMKVATDDAVAMGHDQLYIFTDPEFAKIMQSKFGFRVITRTALVLDLEVNNGK